MRVAAALGVLAVAVAGCSDSEPSAAPGTSRAATTSDSTSGPAGPSVEVVTVEADPAFEIGVRSAPYRVVYVVESLVDDTPDQTERVTVDAPFRGRLEVAAGPPPGGEVTAVQVSILEKLRLGGPDTPVVVHRVPALAVSDIRLAPLLDRALAEGRLELRGQKRVAGRRCQVVRSATLLGGGPLGAIGAGEHADSCVDADGILLEEILHFDGEPALRRVAVSVEVDPPLDDDVFETGEVLAPVDQGGGSVLPVDPEEGAEGEFWVLPTDALPAGFELVGRYAVVPPQPERFEETADAGSPVAGTADVYRRGADALVLYQGDTLRGDDAFADRPESLPVEAGALGSAGLLLSATGSEVRVDRGGGRFVHVTGSIAPEELLAVARSLLRTEGTGLVYLDR